MTVQELPPATIVKASPTLQAAAGMSSSPFTGSVQVQDWGGSWWEFDLTLRAPRGEAARALGAFLVGLRGAVGRFLLAVPQRPVGAAGAPMVAGGGQSGSSITTAGWAAGAAMQAGDFISIGSDGDVRLHQLSAAAVADGSGHAVLQVQPPLRYSPANAAAIEVERPMVVLRAMAAVPYDPLPGGPMTVSFTAREAI